MASDLHKDVICCISSIAEGSMKVVGYNNENKKEENGKTCATLSLNNLTALLSNGNTLFNNFDVSRLTVLNLSNCILEDVPDVFRRLQLKELYLSNVGLKEIPLCLYSGLETLEVLDVSSNMLSNFDIEPRCHAVLKHLYLNYNNLTNLPEWIRGLRAVQLEELNYSYNRIENLKCLLNKYDFKLTTLIMRNCSLRNVDIPFFKNIVTLQKLDLSNEVDKVFKSNFFEDIDELFVKVKWEFMTVLNLSNLSLSVVPEGIVWLENLVELYLMKNSLSWLPTEMEFLVNLEIFDVSDNEISYFPVNFYLLRNIRILKAANNLLYDFKDVSPMEYLEVLDLYNNNLEEFSDFPKSIKMLDLEQNCKDTKECSFYNSYVEKKNEYRKSLKATRIDGPQPRKRPISPSLSRSSSEATDISSIGAIHEDLVDVTAVEAEEEEEDWDKPNRKHEKHPDVTTSDDEWDGDICSLLQEPIIPTKQDRIYNDEWMYCDADDIVNI